MRIRAKANGNIVDVPDGEGQALLDSGIYEPVMAKPKAPAAPKAPAPPKAPAKAPEKSTKVEPLTTQDIPQPVTTPKKGL